MSGEIHDCRACAHSYHEDTWASLTTDCLKAVQVYCGLTQDGPWPHVGSYLGTDRAPIKACKRYVEREGPPKVWPARTARMLKDGVWWTDVEDAPESARKQRGGQSALEDFA